MKLHQLSRKYLKFCPIRIRIQIRSVIESSQKHFRTPLLFLCFSSFQKRIEKVQKKHKNKKMSLCLSLNFLSTVSITGFKTPKTRLGKKNCVRLFFCDSANMITQQRINVKLVEVSTCWNLKYKINGSIFKWSKVCMG
jgi:hypothetical protein